MVHNKKIPASGFALLITLVVVSVVISIGITLIDLTIKQLRLANSSKDSETAFHAVNAGVECIRQWRVASSVAFEAGQVVPISCFDVAANTVPRYLGTTGVYSHDVEITWGGAGAQRCSRIKMITLSPDFAASVTYNNVPAIIPGYPKPDKTCFTGGRCSIISVQGYNRPCTLTSELGTIQREVLLDL